MGRGHAFGRNRPKIFKFLKKAGKIVKACSPEGTLPPEADPEGS
jgi:hypothetical protein